MMKHKLISITAANAVHEAAKDASIENENTTYYVVKDATSASIRYTSSMDDLKETEKVVCGYDNGRMIGITW